MLHDSIKEKIFAREDVSKVPLIYVFTVLNAVEESIEELNFDVVSKDGETGEV